jgi:hypothetical protein
LTWRRNKKSFLAGTLTAFFNLIILNKLKYIYQMGPIIDILIRPRINNCPPWFSGPTVNWHYGILWSNEMAKKCAWEKNWREPVWVDGWRFDRRGRGCNCRLTANVAMLVRVARLDIRQRVLSLGVQQKPWTSLEELIVSAKCKEQGQGVHTI